MRDKIFHSAESNQGDLAFCYRSPSGVHCHTLTIEVIQKQKFHHDLLVSGLWCQGVAIYAIL